MKSDILFETHTNKSNTDADQLTHSITFSLYVWRFDTICIYILSSRRLAHDLLASCFFIPSLLKY